MVPCRLQRYDNLASSLLPGSEESGRYAKGIAAASVDASAARCNLIETVIPFHDTVFQIYCFVNKDTSVCTVCAKFSFCQYSGMVWSGMLDSHERKNGMFVETS